MRTTHTERAQTRRALSAPPRPSTPTVAELSPEHAEGVFAEPVTYLARFGLEVVLVSGSGQQLPHAA